MILLHALDPLVMWCFENVVWLSIGFVGKGILMQDLFIIEVLAAYFLCMSIKHFSYCVSVSSYHLFVTVMMW